MGGLALALTFAAPASAHVPHTVERGETLWSIAAASNLTTRALAAANGLSETAHVVRGSTINVPSVSEAAAALGRAAPVATPPQGAPPPTGAYTVRPGDTLSGIAATRGVSVRKVAYLNGLAADAQVTTGTALRLPNSPGGTPAPSAPVAPATRVVTQAAPHPTPGRVSAGQVGQIAGAHGVSPSLAAAVAYQESGFNNNVVSSANARGVMQILPGTWSWVEGNIARRRLDPTSPQENVHAGVLYLDRLIRDAGGDPVRGVAGYYQGPASVAANGLLPDTERYVQNVMALRSRFGGG